MVQKLSFALRSHRLHGPIDPLFRFLNFFASRAPMCWSSHVVSPHVLYHVLKRQMRRKIRVSDSARHRSVHRHRGLNSRATRISGPWHFVLLDSWPGVTANLFHACMEKAAANKEYPKDSRIQVRFARPEKRSKLHLLNNSQTSAF